MSNKLVKNKHTNAQSQKQNRTLFKICMAILCIAFLLVWADVIQTAVKFTSQMEQMVEGVDYDREKVAITDKRIESDPNQHVAENHFFYYHHGKAYEYHKRMEVPRSIYAEYDVGDSIEAYTTDHKQYYYGKEGILPRTEFRNNELKKCLGALLGIAIFALLLWRIIDVQR